MKLKLSVFISCLLFQCGALMAQKLVLDGNWKYSQENNASYSSPDFADAEWKEKISYKLSFTKEELGTQSSFTWLRKTIVIPTTFNKQLEKTGALSLFLGRIYEADEAWFNGQPIGKTNSSDIQRAYVINAENIRWDKPNTIAIKVNHWGNRSGLQSTTAPYLASALPKHLFTLKSSAVGVQKKQQVKDKQAEYALNITNHSTATANAEISTVFYDFAGKNLQSVNTKMVLATGDNAVRIPYKSPASFLKVRYTITIPKLDYTTTWNDEYGYNDIVYKPAKEVINNKVSDHFIAADLQQQVIKGWLGERMVANEEMRLYKVDEEALLAGYINKPGDHAWIGEHVGKFLDAASFTYKNTRNPAFKIQVDRTAQQLISAQLDNGYFGTYTAENHWTSWDVWSHKYTIIGLLNYYSLSGFKPALDAAAKAGDLLCQTFGTDNGKKDIIKAGEHVGMAATSVLEPMVDLYRFTGDKKYLDFCYYIIKSYDQENGPKIISTLNTTGGRVDKTANKKAYEMLTNLVGVIKLYKVTGDEQFLKPVLLAWNDVVKSRRYITGTASSWEYFKDDDVLPAGEDDHMGEGCVTTTWVQLNYHLLCLSGEMKYLDELERSVYNHLTGAENPQTGCVSYYTPLVGKKPYGCRITCCMSSVPRGISMIPLFANGKIDNKPSFLFYQPGTYSTTVNNAKISFTTVTNFPADGNVSINVNAGSPGALPLEFRKPYWAEGFSLAINGQQQKIENKEATTINRIWKKGDKINIRFSMPVIVLDGGKSYPGQIALQRGPQVLAFDKSLNDFNADAVSISDKNIQLQSSTSPLPDKWIGGSAFQIKGLSNNLDKNIILVPYADASQTGGTITTWIKKEGK